MKWEIARKDESGIRAIKSGLYVIAKQGAVEVTYMLSRTDQPLALGWFASKEEAMQAAEDDAMLFGGKV